MWATVLTGFVERGDTALYVSGVENHLDQYFTDLTDVLCNIQTRPFPLSDLNQPSAGLISKHLRKKRKRRFLTQCEGFFS